MRTVCLFYSDLYTVHLMLKMPAGHHQNKNGIFWPIFINYIKVYSEKCT